MFRGVDADITTAVAADDRTILEEIITEDVRVMAFKDRVKEKCIELGICTRQTIMTFYFNNVPMSSNMILYSDTRRVRARRLHPFAQQIVVARDIDRPALMVPEVAVDGGGVERDHGLEADHAVADQ